MAKTNIIIDDDTISFFKDILAKSLKNKEFCNKLIQSKLKPEHFPKKYQQWLFKSLKEFINNPKYGGKLPSLRIFKDKLENDKTIESTLKFAFYNRIKEIYVRNVQNEEYSFEVVEKFIQKQEFKLLLEESINKLDSHSDPNIAINALVNKSFRLSSKNMFSVVDLLNDVDNRQKLRLDIKNNPKTYKRFKFNIPSIDKCLPGGLTQPLIASIAAKTGRGKSIFTIHIGHEAFKQGFNVTHITSENENLQTTGRYDSKITELKYDDIQLANLKDIDSKKFNDQFSKLKRRYKNRIMIVKCNPNDFTVSTIVHALNMLESQNHKTDFLIIDSPDLMQSVNSNIKDKRLQQAAIYWEVKNLLEEKKCIGFVTTQLTKTSSDENPLAEDLSESYDKSRLLDMLIVLSQNKTHRANNEAILAVVKNRDGKLPSDFITISTEFERMRFFEKNEDDEDKPKPINSKVTVKEKPKLKVIEGGENQLSKLRNIKTKEIGV